MKPSSAFAILALWMGFQSGATFASTEFTGKVLSLDSVPLANASVSLAQTEFTGGAVVKAESTVTDSMGGYSLSFDSIAAPSDWIWNLTVKKTGYVQNGGGYSFPASINTLSRIEMGATYLSLSRPVSSPREMKFTVLLPDGHTRAAGTIITAV